MIGDSEEKRFDWFPAYDGNLDNDLGIPYIMNGYKRNDPRSHKLPANNELLGDDGEQTLTKRDETPMQEEKSAMKKEYFEIRRRLGPDFNPTGW